MLFFSGDFSVIMWCCVTDSENVAADNSKKMGRITQQLYIG